MRHNFVIDIIEVFVVLFVILQSNTVYAHAIEHDYYLMELLILFAFVLLIVGIAYFGLKKKVLINWFVFIFVYYIYIVALALLSGVANDRIMYFATRFLIIFPLFTLIFLLYSSNGIQYRLLDKFVNVMTVISVISLFFWLFVSVLNIVNIKPTSYIYSLWGENYYYPNYFGVYVERQYANLFSLRLLRNQSIFCEAPMFSLCLVFAITFCILLSKGEARLGEKKFQRKKYIKLTILVLALCSTITTTGYIMLALILFGNYCLETSHNMVAKRNKLIIIPLFFLISILFISFVYFGKSDSTSWMVHLEDFVIGFNAWLLSPIYGNGIGNDDVMYSQFSNYRMSMYGMSNSITVVLAQGGILLLAFYILHIIPNVIYSSRRKDFGALLFLGVFTIEFIFTIFQYTALMYFLLALLYVDFLYGSHSLNDKHNNLF